MKLHLFITILFATSVGTAKPKLKREEDLLKIENGTVAVGIDKKKGASITYLSWKGYPKNTVNSADPGRLIQQSYYAGKAFDRTADGQHKAWSPWTWNPIQGGGVGAWAEVTKFKIEGENVLFGETIPKLWDMDNEAAAAVMRQWTSFEKDMSNVIVVRNEFVAKREENDRWGSGVARHQELPAFYFTRNFSQFESYIGGGKWRASARPSVGTNEATSQCHGVFQLRRSRHCNVQPLRNRIVEFWAGRKKQQLRSRCVGLRSCGSDRDGKTGAKIEIELSLLDGRRYSRRNRNATRRASEEIFHRTPHIGKSVNLPQFGWLMP